MLFAKCFISSAEYQAQQVVVFRFESEVSEMYLLLNRLARKNRTKTALARSGSWVDFETDSLRFLFEVLLAEYDSTRHEIGLQVQLAERSVDYLLTVVAALLVASQVLTQSTNQVIVTLNQNPVVYLALALIFLWLPMQHLYRNAHIAILAQYEVYVLAPKINAIATQLSGQSNATQEFLKWDVETFPGWLRGALRWEGFRARGEMSRSAPLFAVVDGLRYIFLSLPSLVFVVSFISVKGSVWTGWTLLERAIGVAFAIIFAIIVIGLMVVIRNYTGLVPDQYSYGLGDGPNPASG